MSEILDNARAHFVALKNAPKRKIYVPEWDATFYVKQLNLAETAEIDAARAISPKDGIIRTMAIRLVDESGQRVFFKHHEKILAEEVDPRIISRVVMEIIEQDKSHEAIEKN